MALSANTVLEIRTGGNDTNGGGFVTGAGGTDWSQQNAAQYSVSDGVAAGTTTITSATANFGTDVVGNLIYIQGGTGSIAANWYQITARINATTITVDRSTGLTAGTGVTLKIGGALATQGGAGALIAVSGVAGMIVWIRSGTYTLSNTSVNTSGGPLQVVISGTNSAPIIWQGYGSTRGDLGTKPILSAGSQNTITLIGSDATHSGNLFVNLSVDGNSQTSVKGFSDNGRRHLFYRCHAANCTNNGFLMSGAFSLTVKCSATGCSTQPAFSGLGYYYCEAFSNTVTGFFSGNSGTPFVGCISSANSGASSDGFSCTGQAISCTAYGNGRDGFRATGTEPQTSAFIGCIAEGNTGFGFGAGGSARFELILNCATYNNTSGGIDSNFVSSLNSGNISYTASAFIDAANGNFGLNNSAGGGALLRAAGFPGLYPRGLTTGYLDIGAVQHQDLPSTFMKRITNYLGIEQ